MSLVIEPRGTSLVVAYHDDRHTGVLYDLRLVQIDLANALRRGHVTRGGNTFDESDLLQIRETLRQIARREAGIK